MPLNTKTQSLLKHLGKYSLAALSADIVAQYRDMRLAGDPDENGKLEPRSNNTVRLELALISKEARAANVPQYCYRRKNAWAKHMRPISPRFGALGV